MTRTAAFSWGAALVAFLAILALVMVANPAAEAAKPLSITNSGFTHNSDCSVDVELTLNTRGRPVATVVIGYVQATTRMPGTYVTYTNLSRGETISRNVPFNDAGNGFSSDYWVQYTAFARNGHILDGATLGTVDNSNC